MEKEIKTVYTYSWKDCIRISRTNDGNWHYHYTIKSIFDYLNIRRKRKGDRLFRWMNTSDTWDVGILTGYKINELLIKCRKSYNS